MMRFLNVPYMNNNKLPQFHSDHPLNSNERDDLHQSLSHFVGGLIRHKIDLDFARKKLDYVYISEVLRNHDGHIGRAAESMGMHRNTLSKRIKDLNIPVKGTPKR